MDENILELVAQHDQAFEADMLRDDRLDAENETNNERPQTADNDPDVRYCADRPIGCIYF